MSWKRIAVIALGVASGVGAALFPPAAAQLVPASAFLIGYGLRARVLDKKKPADTNPPPKT